MMPNKEFLDQAAKEVSSGSHRTDITVTLLFSLHCQTLFLPLFSLLPFLPLCLFLLLPQTSNTMSGTEHPSVSPHSDNAAAPADAMTASAQQGNEKEERGRGAGVWL